MMITNSLVASRNLFTTTTSSGGRRVLSACQTTLLRMMSRDNTQTTDDVTHSPLSRSGTDGKSGKDFGKVSLVTPKTFDTFLYNELKLKMVDESEDVEVEETSLGRPGARLLRNIAATYDFWLVRNNQLLLLYHRLELLTQRVNYLKSVGLDTKQKLRQIQKSPPPLVLTFTGWHYDSKLLYLRGLLRKQNDEFRHMFYPLTDKVVGDKYFIEGRVKVLQDELNIGAPQVIRQLLGLPCFVLDPKALKTLQHMLVHRVAMPQYYHMDQHTAEILPPICDLSVLGGNPELLLSTKARNEDIAMLPTFPLEDILDYSYRADNGQGTPECLTTFLMRADMEEAKDRTAGQPMRGRRGFNMPKRQKGS